MPNPTITDATTLSASLTTALAASDAIEQAAGAPTLAALNTAIAARRL